MLLVKCDHTFLLLSGIVEIICLWNKVGNYITCGLNKSKSHLINVIDNKKITRGERTCGDDPKFLI
jgi:hypothetical protein